MTDEEAVREGLSAALDGVLLALVVTGGVTDDDVPVVALDRALVADGGHIEARKRFRAKMIALRAVLGEDRLELLMDVEEAATDVAVAATSVGFRLGAQWTKA